MDFLLLEQTFGTNTFLLGSCVFCLFSPLFASVFNQLKVSEPHFYLISGEKSENFLKANDIHIKDLLKLLFLLLDNKLINKKRLQKQFIQLK